MIACLKGELFYTTADALVVDVNGVGYEVFFPQANHHRLPEVGREIFLYIQTVVREDAINLYGFLDAAEKEMFRLLVGVSGVGPKLAVAILSGMAPRDLARSIAAEDIARLTRIPGVGKKTAERLCLELKEKVEWVPEAMPSTGAASQAYVSDDQRVQDVISALVNLGYPVARAREALDRVRRQMEAEAYAGMELEELLRQALRALA